MNNSCTVRIKTLVRKREGTRKAINIADKIYRGEFRADRLIQGIVPRSWEIQVKPSTNLKEGGR